MKHANVFATAFLLGMLFAVSATAAPGRLNFMLVNLTGMDIVGTRICPTYYPNYMSDNLLQTKLEPNTRIYIGPNYYGDQKYWNIQLTWANGFTHTFTHTRLTRYNTYITYASPYGVRLRQSFERAFARYDFSPNAAMFPGSAPGSFVAVSMPEKVNLAGGAATPGVPGSTVAFNQAAAMIPTQEGRGVRRTRDLVFDEEDEAVPAVAGSNAASVKGDTIAMKTTVEVTRNGKTNRVLPTEDFQSGDRVRMFFSTNRDGRIYWLSKGTSGQYQVLFPTVRAGMDNTVTRNKEYTVPSKGAWRFDDRKGTETLVCVLSPHAVADLDKAVQLSDAGDKIGASRIIENVVSGHEAKRTTRDLVFEEEDDLDVNTKSQKANGDEPFVAIYELTHN